MIKVEVMIKDLDYKNIADKVTPMMVKRIMASEKSNRFSRIFSGFEEIPSKVVKAVFDCLPKETKDELIISVVTEYKKEIMDGIKETAAKNNIPIELSDIKITHF